jgi:IS605 OrfB family transposase
VDRIASWNRQYINPAVYLIRTDFGRLAKRYEAVSAVVITEELGKNPQEEMIGVEKKKVGRRELRHRIKQTPFKKLLKSIEDKVAEGGSAVFYVSSFRNSRVCPIHFAELEDGVTGMYCTAPGPRRR